MKLYLVVRCDIPHGAMIAQACHAMRAFATAYPQAERLWYASSNNLVVLSVPDEPALEALEYRLRSNGVDCVHFREPDMGSARTAMAVGGDGARFLSSLPLALRARPEE